MAETATSYLIPRVVDDHTWEAGPFSNQVEVYYKVTFRAGGHPTGMHVLQTVCWFTSDYCRFWMLEAYKFVRPVPTHCKQRAADFEAREKRIEANATISLKPGTKKADVTAFLASEKIPMDSYQIAGRNEVTGQIYVEGLAECASVACGDDSAMIGVRVNVDENGTVVSDPVVLGMFIDCL